MVVRNACLYWLMPHWHWRARGRMERIIISMESAIQHNPTTSQHTNHFKGGFHRLRQTILRYLKSDRVSSENDTHKKLSLGRV
jgi:hypothetical protein